MDLLKKIFNDDEQIVGLCAFKKHAVHKVYNNVQSFSATKLVYSIKDRPQSLNMFATA